MRPLRCAIAAAAFVAVVTPAVAHTRSQSQSAWSVEGDRLSVRVEADALDVTRLYALGGTGSLTQTLADEAAQAFDVSANGQTCAPAGPARGGNGATGRIVANLAFDCTPGALEHGEVSIASRLFLRVAPSHLHFAAIHDNADRSAEAVLTEAHPRATLRLSASPAREGFVQALARFFPIGAAHVWSGLDHIAFMLALVLAVAGRWRPALLAATGFTLGHTLTLGLAATGVLAPDTAAIEALIGFTIAFVAFEIGADGAARMQRWSLALAGLMAIGGGLSLAHLAPMSPLIWFGLAGFTLAYPRGFPRGATWLAAIFGLIHGCGFAGALADLGLPKPRLLASLLGFNLGVEAGQTVVIGAALALGFAARRLPEPLRANALPASGAALFALGLYWFVARLL